jgi:pyruvate formate lyase activating enzyme
MAVNQKPFFGRRGGITFSGGEPTAQAAQLIPLFKRLKEEGINICVDTNGGIWNSSVEELLGMTDLVLLDCKQINPSRHEELTGRSNAQTLKTAQWLEDNGRPFWLRYVLVPGISDFEEDIRALGEHFRNFKMVQRVEILPYHTLGMHKYESLGQEYRLKDTPLNTQEQLNRALQIFQEYFNCTVMN